MKPIFCILIYCLSLTSSYGQSSTVELSHYVFPLFMQGEILMKSGDKYKVRINYNSLSEEMIFEEMGKKLAINQDQLDMLDTVFIADRKFIRLNDKFFELLYHATSELYAEYKCQIEYPGTTDGYGTSSQTSSSDSYASMKSRGTLYELSLPDDFKTNPYTVYWIKKNGELNKFRNLKQLMKVYKNKKDLFKAYIKKHDVQINDQKSIVLLIEYLEAG